MSKTARNSDGTFKKGHSGNPDGALPIVSHEVRKMGIRRLRDQIEKFLSYTPAELKAELDSNPFLTTEDITLIQAIVNMGKSGDLMILDWMYSKLYGKGAFDTIDSADSDGKERIVQYRIPINGKEKKTV